MRVLLSSLVAAGSVAGLAGATLTYQAVAGGSSPEPVTITPAAEETATAETALEPRVRFRPCREGFERRGAACVRVRTRYLADPGSAGGTAAASSRAASADAAASSLAGAGEERSEGRSGRRGGESDQAREVEHELEHEAEHEVEHEVEHEAEHEDRGDDHGRDQGDDQGDDHGGGREHEDDD